MINRISMAQPIQYGNYNRQKANNYQSQVAFCAAKPPVNLYDLNEKLLSIIYSAQAKTIEYVGTTTGKSGKIINKFESPDIGTILTNVNDTTTSVSILSKDGKVEIPYQKLNPGFNPTIDMTKAELKKIMEK